MEMHEVRRIVAFCMKRMIILSSLLFLAILLTSSQVFAQATGTSPAQRNPFSELPGISPYQPYPLDPLPGVAPYQPYPPEQPPAIPPYHSIPPVHPLVTPPAKANLPVQSSVSLNPSSLHHTPSYD